LNHIKMYTAFKPGCEARSWVYKINRCLPCLHTTMPKDLP